MDKYTLYEGSEIFENGNNKQILINKARKMTTPATVEDNICKGIIFENKAQRRINNSF